LTRFISALWILVPDNELTIRAHSAQSIVGLVKWNTIDSIDITIACCLTFISMTLKAEITWVNLVWIHQINVNYSASSFNTSYCITFTISKATNCACLKFQRALNDMNWIELASGNVLKIPAMNNFFWMRCDHQRITCCHVMNWLRYPTLTYLLYLLALNLVEFHYAVPTCWNKINTIICWKRTNILHRSIVLSNRLRSLSTIDIPS
jgi:hypothetical protein